MPLTLSAIMDFAQNYSASLKPLLLREPEVNVTASDLSSVQVPESAIGSLQALLAASVNRAVSARVNRIVQRIQINNSRIRCLVSSADPHRLRVITAVEIQGLIVDNAILYALTSSVFAFARQKSEKVGDVKWSDVEMALLHLDWDASSHPGVFEHLARRQSQSNLVE